MPLPVLEKELERAGLRLVAQHEVTSRHQITRSSTNLGRQRLLFEVAAS